VSKFSLWYVTKILNKIIDLIGRNGG